MGAASRDKGKRGERELAEFLRGLTGSDVRRRVRQHDGDSDLEGLPGWCVECKRHATAAPADVARWWRQTAAQAHRVGAWPLLAWRADRMRDWVFVWPAGLHCPDAPPQSGHVADTLAADLVAHGAPAGPAISFRVLPGGGPCG